MNPRSTLSLLVLAGIGLAMSPAETGRSLTHDVYFTLLDASCLLYTSPSPRD